MTVAAPPIEAFVYVDTAIGGGHHRNNVMRVDDFDPPTGAVDCFATYLRYTDALPEYVATHRNRRGKPSVEGYEGIAFAPFLPFDFDSADDLPRAQADAVRFLQRLNARYDVPLDACRVYFSGSKGFSIEIPATVFGGFAPATDLPARFRLLATDLTEGLATLDQGIYQHIRLWRMENTVNGRSGLHKIPLTVAEVMTRSVDDILALATEPRAVETVDDDEWTTNPDLAVLWEQTAVRLRERPAGERVDMAVGSCRLTDHQLDRVVEIVSPFWSLGQKHDLAICLAGFLGKSARIGEEQTLAIIERLAAGDDRPGDRTNAVHDTYERIGAGRAVLGYVGLTKILSSVAMIELQQIVAGAEATADVGGQRYRAEADEPPPPFRNGRDRHADDTEPPDDDGDEAAAPGSADEDDGDGGDLFSTLHKRARGEPARFVRETLQSTETIGALARAARHDRGTYEALLLELREIGVKAGDIKRLERAINAALQSSRPRFRLVDDEEAPSLPRVRDAIPAAPVTDQAVVPPHYRLTPFGVTEEHLTDDGEQKSIALSPVPIVMTGRLVDVGDGSESVRMAWVRDGDWRQRTVDRGIAANARELVGMANVGFPVTSRTAGDLVGYIAAYEAANIDHLPRARVSGQMGWQGDAGELGFLWGRTLLRAGDDGEAAIDLDELSPEDWREDWVSFHGADTGDTQIADAFHAEGDFDEWKAATTIAAKYPRVVMALYAALAAPILEILGAPNFIIDWSFVTSTGKTTALRVAASCWGNPNEQGAASTLGTWDSTRVYIERRSAILNGLPLLLDDTKRAKFPKQVAQTIYDVSSGQGRGRGSPKGMRRSGSWATVLLSTGEAPATSFTEDGGTRARVLTLWGPPFGRADAATAADVHRLDLGIRHNYGHAGPRFVRHLLAHRDEWDAWRDEYRAIQADYLARANGNPVAGRLATYFAILDMAALLAHDALDLPWPCDEPVKDLWADLIAEASEADRGEAALAMVISWAQANQHAFDGRLILDHNYNERIPTTGIVGRWDKDETWKTINFYPHKLAEILAAGNFETDAILRAWNDREWLETNTEEGKRRTTKRMRIRGENARVIAIRRPAIEGVTGC